MTPQEFTRRHELSWQRFQRLLDAKKGEAPADFPQLYREICSHLALARDRHYPLALVERLNLLALAGQQRLYRHQGGLWTDCLQFLAAGFPQLLRRHAGLFWLSSALFYLPLAAIGFAVYLHPSLIYSVLGEDQVHSFEGMYASGNKHIGIQNEGGHVAMFGYYVRHNTGIGFQTFAGGLFAGVGSLLFVIINAVQIGAVAGYLTELGDGVNFWSFVCTHSAFELTAIVISGMAGLLLGLALVAPGQQSRADALVSRGRDGVRLIYGAATLFFVAALIEGFWSSSTALPPEVKYASASLAWLLVGSYFLFAGRGRHAP